MTLAVKNIFGNSFFRGISNKRYKKTKLISYQFWGRAHNMAVKVKVSSVGALQADLLKRISKMYGNRKRPQIKGQQKLKQTLLKLLKMFKLY